MRVRIFFVLQRFLGYAAVFLAALWTHPHQGWWQWLLAVVACVWGVSEFLKRPDDTSQWLLIGVWLEVLLILLWAVAIRDAVVLFLLVSPTARSGVHLGWQNSVFVSIIAVLGLLLARHFFVLPQWLFWMELAIFLFATGYSVVLGFLLQEREKLMRQVQISAFHREQYAKDAERMRMAGQLHDTLGQHWTGVIRALDVAQTASGEQQQTFLTKARETAVDGLNAMRAATHAWDDGMRTPTEWLEYADDALQRLQELTGTHIHFESTTLEWERLEDGAQVGELLARTLIEGVTNAIRHGVARNVVARLEPLSAGIQLVVRDDGNGGPSPEPSQPSGTGITTLQSLANRLGGTLTLQTGSTGAQLVLQIPYKGARDGGSGDLHYDSNWHC